MVKGVIRIIDLNFTLKAEIDNYESLLFTRRHSIYGEFELRINAYKNYASDFVRGDILYLDRNRAGFIEHIEGNLDKSGKEGEVITIKGYTLEYLLTRRITLPFPGAETWSADGSGEDIIKSLADYNLGSSAIDPKRRIPELKIAPSKGRGKTLKFETRYGQLEQEVDFICSKTDIGIYAYLDYGTKKIVLDVIEGRNLTTEQDLLPPVIFSVDFDNILEQQYIDSGIDYKNMAYVGGDGEGVNREIAEINNGEHLGIDRREIFIDAKGNSGEELIPLEERGKEKLSLYKEVQSLTGKINPFHGFKYEKDFFLRDKVTMKYNGIVLHAVITEVTESWEADGYSIECQFGDKVPTLIEKIQRRL